MNYEEDPSLCWALWRNLTRVGQVLCLGYEERKGSDSVSGRLGECGQKLAVSSCICVFLAWKLALASATVGF